MATGDKNQVDHVCVSEGTRTLANMPKDLFEEREKLKDRLEVLTSEKRKMQTLRRHCKAEILAQAARGVAASDLVEKLAGFDKKRMAIGEERSNIQQRLSKIKVKAGIRSDISYSEFLTRILKNIEAIDAKLTAYIKKQDTKNHLDTPDG